MFRHLGLLCAYSFVPRVFWDADDGTGGGGGTGNPPVDLNEKKYGDNDVKQMVDKRMRKSAKEIEAQKTANAALEAKIVDLEAKIAAGVDGAPADKQQLGQLEILKTRLENQVKDLTTQVTLATTQLAEEVSTRRNMERTAEIQKGLVKAHVLPEAMEAAEKYFRDKVQYDAEEGHWFYETTSGNPISVEDGIVANCPDFMKEATMRGGSGTTTGTTRTRRAQTELDAKKAELEKWMEIGKKDARNNDALVQCGRIRKEIKRLEASLQAA